MMSVLPSANMGEKGGTLVFFDDDSYVLEEPQRVARLREQLFAHAQRKGSGRANLLVLADRRVAAGELMKLVGIARESGIGHVQIAESRK